MALDLYSEPYAPTGNLGDTGIRKLLGAPSLDLLQTVVRESVQNSCDAAKLGRGPEIRFRLRTLDADQMRCLTGEVLARQPADTGPGIEGPDPLPGPESEPVRVLEIVDIGTTGLAGPVRADRIPPGTRYTDFVDFFRNVGTARNTESGGGTYGFGKVALYLASASSTILVDTLSEFRGEPVRRFMGCRLGPAHDVPDAAGNACRHTGRSWWGACGPNDAVADPLEGAAAAALAARLGMPERAPHESGTTVMILSPRLGDLDAGDFAHRIAEQLLWQFWPRLTADTPDSQRIRPQVELEGVGIPVPPPEQFPPLNLYARALALVRADAPEVQPVRGARNRLLGSCATVRGIASPGTGPVPREGRSHAIALMRPVGFVVCYVQGPPLPDPAFEWAGVFVADADPDTEAAFAGSEPPAHDEWQPRMLPSGSVRRIVQTALRKVRDIAGSVAGDVVPATAEASDGGHPAAAVATALGGLLVTDAARRPEPVRRKRGPGRPRTVARAGRPRLLRIGTDGDGPFAEFGVEVVTGARACRLAIAAGPVLDGALVRRSSSTRRVHVLGVSGPGGDSPCVASPDGALCDVAMRHRGELVIRTSLPDNMAVGIEVSLSLAEGSS